MLACFGAGIFLLGVAVYVLGSPAEFLRSPLARYRMRPDTPKWEVRSLGVIMIIGAAFVLWLGERLLVNLFYELKIL